MAISDDATVVGITGSFGSGCSEVAGALRQKYRFETFCLSDSVRSELEERKSPIIKWNLQIVGTEDRQALAQDSGWHSQSKWRTLTPTSRYLNGPAQQLQQLILMKGRTAVLCFAVLTEKCDHLASNASEL